MTNDDFIPDVDEYTKDILLDKEYEIAGMYITEHPLDRYQEVIEKITYQRFRCLVIRI